MIYYKYPDILIFLLILGCSLLFWCSLYIVICPLQIKDPQIASQEKKKKKESGPCRGRPLGERAQVIMLRQYLEKLCVIGIAAARDETPRNK